MRAVMVSVNYSDFLSVSLPYNSRHWDDVLVITSPEDWATQAVARDHNAALFKTDAFTRNGAHFNKWLALEEGLDYFGRTGWLVLCDADTLWPHNASSLLKRVLRPGCLFTPMRRMMEEIPYPFEVPPESQWGEYPLHPQQHEFAGYTQVFHAQDPVLGEPPWHDTGYVHAGTADSWFQAKWPQERKVRPRFQVLHLGSAGKNWLGRVTKYLDGRTPEGAQERWDRLREMMIRRHGKTGMARFAHERIRREET